MKRFRNRWVAFVLAYLLIVMPPVPLWAAGAIYPRGDLNGDQFIDVDDQAILRDLLLGRIDDSAVAAKSDFNLDSTINVADMVALVNYKGDWDGDNIPDLLDDYPTSAALSNRTLEDYNLDTDNDGYAEPVDAYRVDKSMYLPGGSATDSDGDGLPNSLEDNGSTEWPYITDSLLADTDRDGLGDGAEKLKGTNPLNPDTDGDGVLDGYDANPLSASVQSLTAAPAGEATPAACRLTPTQIQINNAWQAERDKNTKLWLQAVAVAKASGTRPPALADWLQASMGSSGRGLGFQGPSQVGSNFDSVQSDKFSGAFSYAIPIKVPPGRGGLEPRLTLLYRSTNSHSWLGQGWDLNPGRIERSTRNGVPKYDNPSNPAAGDGDPFTPLDNPDTYVYRTAAGAQELVYTGTETIGGTACGIYHAELDPGSFVRFIHHPDAAHPAGGAWEIQWKDGRKAFFNIDLAADAAIATAGGGIFCWGIEREEDASGNAIQYSYQRPAGTNNLFLQYVRYNFVGGTPMVQIGFGLAARSGNEAWASYRESYRSGMKIVADRFLSTITETVARRGEVNPGHPERVRKYRLQYHDLNWLGGRTIACLKSVQELGETDALSFPPVTLDYSLLAKGFDARTAGLPDDSYTFLATSGNTGTDIVDFDGDGLPDVMRLISRYDSRYVWRVALNSGSGFQQVDWNSGLPTSFWFAFWGIYRGGDIGTRIMDLNGDGVQDLLHLQKTHTGAFVKKIAINNGGAFADSTAGLVDARTPDSSEAIFIYTPENGSGTSVGGRPMDINDDGLCDVVRLDESRGISEAEINNGNGFTKRTTGLPSMKYTFLAASGHTGTEAMDLNGDGLNDIVRLVSSDNSLYVWRVAFNKGTGFDEYDNHEFLPSSFWFALWGINRGGDFGTRIMDLNGDHLLDFVHLQKTDASPYYVRTAALNTGAGFYITNDFGLPLASEPVDLVFIYRASGESGADVGTRIMDVNGDGLSDIIRNQEGKTKLAAIRRGGAGASAPNLLVKIDNGIGGTVDVAYTPSNKAWMRLRDPATGTIETTDKLPYILQVVSKITRTAQRPENVDPSNPDPATAGAQARSYTTLYRYSAGRHLDREFRGFGKVKEIDAQTGNFTITEYYQDYSRKGRVKSVREYVGHRGDYRDTGDNIVEPRDEKTSLLKAPSLVKQTHHRYRVVVHAQDPLHLKTFTDTDVKLGLTGFPRGVTLVTPACTLEKTYEYSGDYDKSTTDLRDDQIVVTAREQFFDGRGNPTQTIDFGQVTAVTAGLDQPRLDITFVDDSGSAADGRVIRMTRYDQKRGGTWMDVPVRTNTAGFYTNAASGARETAPKILEAQTIGYDSLNRVVAETSCLDTGADPSVHYAYDAYGNRNALTDPAGGRTTTDYDGIYHCFPARQTNPLGHVEQYAVDPGHGNLLTLTDANGRASTAQYDGLGRIAWRKDSTGTTVTSYRYGFFGYSAAMGVYVPNLVRTIVHSPTGAIWNENHADGLGRPYQTLALGQRGDANPIRTVTEFNDRGIAWKVSLPHWAQETPHWTYTFLENDNREKATAVKAWDHPGLNRTAATVRELNATESAQTDIVYESPLATKTLNPRGVGSRDIKDGFGNRVEAWEPNDLGSVGLPPRGAYEGRATSYGHDALGRLEYVRRSFDPDFPDRDPVTRISYDSLGRIVRLIDPDTAATAYTYDIRGNLTGSTDARNIQVTRRYDALGRLTTLSYPDSQSTATLRHIFTWDTGSGTYLVGRLARVEAPACEANYSYDTEGRVKSVRRVIGGVHYKTYNYYDFAGRKTAMTYPDGTKLNFHYDPVTQALDAITDPDTGQVWLGDMQKNEFDAIETLKLGNGLTRTNTADFSGRVTRSQTSLWATAISDLAYTYDLNSNVTRIRESAGATPTGDMHYDYDRHDRLVAAWGTTLSGAAAGESFAPAYHYAYDSLGRITANSRFENATYGAYTLEYEYSANPQSDRPAHGPRAIRFTKAAVPTVYAHTFRYDAAGNLTGSTNETAAVARNNLNRTCTWDALGRMESLANAAGKTTFAYDHTKKRVRKTDPSGKSVVYVGDVMEVTAAGVTKHIFAGSQRIATITPAGQKLFAMTDHQRSTTLVANHLGSVVQRMDYEPYGDLIENARSGNALGLRHTFTGQEDDPETGLMNYDARYYDPAVAVFVSPDRLTRRQGEPQRFASPDLFATAQSRPQAFNRYAYCGGNPVTLVDDTGEFAWVAAILIGAAVGAAIGLATSVVAASVQGQDLADINTWADIGIDTAIGAASGAIGGGVAGGTSTVIGSQLAKTGLKVGAQSLIRSGVSGAVGSSVGGFAGGTASGFHAGYGAEKSLALGGVEAAIGLGVGAVGGVAGAGLARPNASAYARGQATGARTGAGARGTKDALLRLYGPQAARLHAQYEEEWTELCSELMIGSIEGSVAVPTTPFKPELADRLPE